MAYVNPDAVTQIANGLSTTTFTYDNNGNVTQKTTDGTTTTYVYDYANRLTALGVLGATTTYGYDAFGARVLQTGTSTTYLYPFKWYSVASSTGTGAKFATTTDYVFNGDSLLATIDQQTASGNATGTARTRYVHPDHLGGTNVVTDENENLVQTLDFYPYGSTRISVATSTNEKRQFIGQFTDDSTLSYLQARYYDSARGQFLSQDPMFLGDPKKQDLLDPQDLNSYSYAVDNPINKSDPKGLWYKELLTGQQSWPSFEIEFGQAAGQLSEDSPGWNFAISHPIATGGLVGIAAFPALESGGALSGAYYMGTAQGVGTTFAAQQGFAALVYASLAAQNTLAIPGVVNTVASANFANPSSFYSAAMALGLHIGPNLMGGYVGAINDAFQFSKLVIDTLGAGASNLWSSSIQARQNTTTQFNSSIGGSGSGSRSGGTSGGGSPNPSSLWVTPSGAVVTFGGSLVAPPPTK
jgi:RHS repeat-associated protein